MDKGYILALGLNPAWQKTLHFDRFRVGEVNRSLQMTHMASGKGINFCRAAAGWGVEARLIQFLGGENGRRLAAELEQEGMAVDTVWTEAETRVCTTCLCADSGRMTEIIDPSGEVSAAEVSAVLEDFDAALSGCRGIALCGTVPPGVGDGVYVHAAKRASECGKPLLLDSWRDVDRVLAAGVGILKINREEVCMMTGKAELMDAINHCRGMYPDMALAITDGGGTAYLADRSGVYCYVLPLLGRVVNPLGAGDTAAAVMFAEFLKGDGAAEAFASGLAAASASCMTGRCAVYDPALAADLRRKIVIERIGTA